MKIQHKLFWVLFGLSATLVISIMILIQVNINKGMLEYVNNKQAERLEVLAAELAEIYATDNDWSYMEGQNRRLKRLFHESQQNEFVPPHLRRERGSDRGPAQDKGPGKGPRLEQDRRPPPRGPAGKKEALALLDVNDVVLAGSFQSPFGFVFFDIIVDKTVVGRVALEKHPNVPQGFEFDFIQQQQQFLFYVALFALLLVALVTVPLSRHVVNPLKILAKGIRSLTLGDYEQKVNLKRNDELGELSKYYNELALTLEQNESLRKRWIANISHELRTPVAILKGELEAIIDKVRPLDMTTIESANDEVNHLKNLIEDLHQLSSADVGGMNYRKEDIEVNQLLTTELNKYQSFLSDYNIELSMQIPVGDLTVYADKTRLLQLFENLLSNAAKYSQATAMRIHLSKQSIAQSPWVKIEFFDNGVGVSDDNLPKLFDYLYRVEDSRNRSTGGAGLGLSICSHIVEAHMGTISALRNNEGGLSIVIMLPLEIE